MLPVTPPTLRAVLRPCGTGTGSFFNGNILVDMYVYTCLHVCAGTRILVDAFTRVCVCVCAARVRVYAHGI